METKSIKKNYLYNLAYQILILILPIVTTPYISRVLGAEKVGIYSFTISIVTYFSLFGTLGVSLYGQREIAYARENKSKRKKTFFEIILFRFITMAISIGVFCFTYVRNPEYGKYYQILILYLLAAAFDISWFFQGMEEFKKTVTRNVIVRIVSVCSIFLFVKAPEDLWKYLLIYSLADLVGNLSLWLYLPKYFKGTAIKNINIKRHMIPIMLLFIPQIAIKLYNVVDKTMIGYMITEKSALGNYEEAYKVINVLFTVVSSLGIVMVPRIASVFASGDKKTLNQYIVKSFRFMFFLAFPMMIGLMTISKEFVPIFLGEGYENAVGIVNILAPMILRMWYYQCNRNAIFTTNQKTKTIHHIDFNRISCEYYFEFNCHSTIWSIWSSSSNNHSAIRSGICSAILYKKGNTTKVYYKIRKKIFNCVSCNVRGLYGYGITF